MAIFYLVRHGEAVYDHMLESGFWGFGRDFAPLSRVEGEHFVGEEPADEESATEESGIIRLGK